MADFEAILGSSVPAWLTRAQESMQGGDAAAALKTSEEARKQCRSKADKKGEGASLIMVAKAAFEVGSWDVGTKASGEALHIFQATKDAIGESAALMLVSNACLLAGDFAEAVSSAEDAATLAKSSGATKQMAYCKASIASATLALLQNQENDDPDLQAKALEAAQEAASAFREIGEKAEMAKVVSDLAMAYLISGNSNMALAKAKMAQRLYQADMNVAGEARSLIIISKALQKEGSGDAAMQTLEDAANLFGSIGDQQGQAEAYELMQAFQNLSVQEKKDFTQRVMQRFQGDGAAAPSSSAGAKPHFFLPPQQPVTLGPATTKFIGFMGRAATVVAPKGSSGSAPQQNRFLLYNVSWN
jgi:tetratricopeptide (TPR) repeat protein